MSRFLTLWVLVPVALHVVQVSTLFFWISDPQSRIFSCLYYCLWWTTKENIYWKPICGALSLWRVQWKLNGSRKEVLLILSRPREQIWASVWGLRLLKFSRWVFVSHAAALGDRDFCVLLFLVYLPPSTSSPQHTDQVLTNVYRMKESQNTCGIRSCQRLGQIYSDSQVIYLCVFLSSSINSFFFDICLFAQ